MIATFLGTSLLRPSALALQALLTLGFHLPPPAAQGEGPDLRARFEALDGDPRDPQALLAVAELWREHPGLTLGVIDSYLEGSLAKFEKHGVEAQAEIAAMEARALRGAQAADRAFGTSIFGDYASAFASWNPEEQARFRRGQALYGEASKALRAKDPKGALAKARESLELARPLGDWWGSAMALSALARAHGELGEQAQALDFAAQARLLNHGLRLLDAELADLELMLRAAEGLGRRERAAEAARAGASLAEQLKNAAAAQVFGEAQKRLTAK